ncbi:MAG: PilZ domain-containing protein [Chromatiales bacterium]|nr:PilZ domain-containing protein [Chromatiales bacterium]
MAENPSVPFAKPGAGILNVSIRDENALYSAWMPFVRGGALFIPTEKPYKLGDEVFMLLSLMDDRDKLPVAGRVVWITPRGADGYRQPGIGVQFTTPDGKARMRIENYLAHRLNSDAPTHTM